MVHLWWVWTDGRGLQRLWKQENWRLICGEDSCNGWGKEGHMEAKLQWASCQSFLFFFPHNRKLVRKMKPHFSRSCTDRTRAICSDLKDRFRLDIRKKFPVMRVVKHCIAQSGGRCSIPGNTQGQAWTELWAIWSSWGCPCSLQKGRVLDL